MPAGDLDRRITIYRPSERKGPYNDEQLIEWTEVGQAWASVEISGGTEVEIDGQENERTTGVFRTWYRTDIDKTMKITFDGRDYHVKTVEEIGRRYMIEITAEYIEGYAQ